MVSPSGPTAREVPEAANASRTTSDVKGRKDGSSGCLERTERLIALEVLGRLKFGMWVNCLQNERPMLSMEEWVLFPNLIG